MTPCFDCLAKMSHVVKVSSKTIQNWSRYLGLCVIMVETWVVTPCFNCLTKMSPVVKVSHKTMQHWSRYLALCVPVADHGPRPCKISHKLALQRDEVV